jgi:hypothetical protein
MKTKANPWTFASFDVIAAFIELDSNDIKAVAVSIPRVIKPIPVILAIQRPSDQYFL